MANVGQNVRTYLQTKSAVTDLISTRMYPLRLPQNATMPAITYQIVSRTHEEHMTGAAGLALARLQLDCYATTHAGSHALAEAVRASMHGYRGTMGTDFMQMCHLDNDFDDVDDPRDASDDARYIFVQDWMIWVVESVPSF